MTQRCGGWGGSAISTSRAQAMAACRRRLLARRCRPRRLGRVCVRAEQASARGRVQMPLGARVAPQRLRLQRWHRPARRRAAVLARPRSSGGCLQTRASWPRTRRVPVLQRPRHPHPRTRPRTRRRPRPGGRACVQVQVWAALQVRAQAQAVAGREARARTLPFNTRARGRWTTWRSGRRRPAKAAVISLRVGILIDFA